MTDQKKITPKNFDDLTGEKAGPVIWTAAAIARRIGRSEGYVRKTLARLDGTPVRRHGRGNLYAYEADLVSFMGGERA